MRASRGRRRGPWPWIASLDTPAGITAAQQRLPPFAITNRATADYIRSARWLELEARRWYDSRPRTLFYAANMRWAAELTRIYGDGTWPELLARSGNRAPGFDRGQERHKK